MMIICNLSFFSTYRSKEHPRQCILLQLYRAACISIPTSANYCEAWWFITFIMVYWSKQRWRDSLYARALSWMCAGIGAATHLADVFRWDEAGCVSSLALQTFPFKMLEAVCLLCYEVSARTLFKCIPLQIDKHGYESIKNRFHS